MYVSRGYKSAKSFYLSKLFWNAWSVNNQWCYSPVSHSQWNKWGILITTHNIFCNNKSHLPCPLWVLPRPVQTKQTKKQKGISYSSLFERNKVYQSNKPVMLHSRCVAFNARWDCVMQLREFDWETRQTKNSKLMVWQCLSFSKSCKILLPSTLSFKEDN